MFNLLNLAPLMAASVIGISGNLFQQYLQIPVTNFLPIRFFPMQETVPVIPIAPPEDLVQIPVPPEQIMQTSTTESAASAPVALKEKNKAEPAKKPQKTETPPTKQSPAPKPAIAKISTPQEALDAISFSTAQRIDGAYVLTFHLNAGGSPVNWGFADSVIGGTASLPKMNAEYSCVPQWNPAQENSSDPNPTFDMNASYACDVSLTDSFLRTASKKITFRTGVGRLVVKSSNLNTQLKSGSNYNGLVLDNQSDSEITVTGMTLYVSFKALNVSSPVIVRVVNPENENSYSDFPVQNLADVLRPYDTYGTEIKPDISFSMAPRSSRLLPVEVLGIQQLLKVGINPEFDVSLRQLEIGGDSGVKTVFFTPEISWSCIPFDPSTSLTGIPTDQNCK